MRLHQGCIFSLRQMVWCRGSRVFQSPVIFHKASNAIGNRGYEPGAPDNKCTVSQCGFDKELSSE